jgi:hypothetical protein
MLSYMNYYLLIRSSRFGWHILLRRNLTGEVTLYFYGIPKGIVLIFLISYFSLRDYQGVIPTIIS